MKAPTKLKNRRGERWTLAELEHLGKVPDSVLARRSGRTIKEIVAERERLRIRLPTPPRRWTEREIRMLGRYNDNELARRLRRENHQVRRMRLALRIPPVKPVPKSRAWTRAEVKLLGTIPDALLARRFHRTELSVAGHR